MYIECCVNRHEVLSILSHSPVFQLIRFKCLTAECPTGYKNPILLDYKNVPESINQPIRKLFHFRLIHQVCAKLTQV